MNFPYEKLPAEVNEIFEAVRNPAWRGLLPHYREERLALQERVAQCWMRIPAGRRLAIYGDIDALLRKQDETVWPNCDVLILLRTLKSLTEKQTALSAQQDGITDCGQEEKPTATPQPAQTLDLDLAPDAGALPTAFVRSALFADGDSETQVFDVLGMPMVKVERSGPALGETQLLVLAYLVSLVEGYDSIDGALVEFTPWEAVRGVYWTRSSQSVVRLQKALEGLAVTQVRIIQAAAQAPEAAPVLRLSNDWQDAKHWKVQLTAAFIRDLQAYHTYVRLDVLHKLPNGVTTRLYLLLYSEKYQSTTWPVRELAHLAGLTSRDEHHVKDKLQQALTVLVQGVHCVKARGVAVSKHESLGLGTPLEANKTLSATSAKLTVHTFTPILATFDFRRDRHGRLRVQLEKTAAVVKGSTASAVKGSKKHS